MERAERVYEELGVSSLRDAVETLARLESDGEGLVAVRVIQLVSERDGKDVADYLLDRAIARARELQSA